MNRRNTRTNPCTVDNYDYSLVENTINEVGCKVYPIKKFNETKFCKTKMEYRKFQKKIRLNDHPPPCHGFTSMSKRQGEEEGKSENKNGESKAHSVIFTVRFIDDSFKKLIYLQAYTVESLVGNTGGYIGVYSNLFLYLHKIILLKLKFDVILQTL